VVLQRKRPKGLANLVFARAGRDLQVGIVIPRRIGLDHGGGCGVEGVGAVEGRSSCGEPVGLL
jgi:hypothetical protein